MRSRRSRSALLSFVVFIGGGFPGCLFGTCGTTSQVQAVNNDGEDDNQSAGYCNNSTASTGEGSCAWNDVDNKRDDNYHDCTLVMAPSTIPKAGLGIFTLVDLFPDQNVGSGGDLVLPMKELLMIQGTMKTIFDDYTWSGRIYNGMYPAYAPGLQSLANSHLGLFNIFPQPASMSPQDQNGNDDSARHHHMKTVVGEHPIPAGGELFAMYGDHWFQGRSDLFGGDASSSTISSDDYFIAEEMAKTFQSRFGESNYNFRHNHNHWMMMDLWDVVGDFIHTWNGHSAARVLPGYSDLRQVQQLGIRSLYQSQSTMDVNKLRETMTTTSRCIDGITSGPSKIHNYGAFATRKYSKGSIIIGSPVLHSQVSLWDSKFQVWDADTKTYKLATPKEGTTAGQQQSEDAGDFLVLFEHNALLINYCWSHEKSSILLCPYAPGVGYINHASSNQSANKNDPSPNVKIQWAPNGQLSQNDNNFQKSPKQLTQNHTQVSLAFDYIALRDIEAGEELFIDYGKTWDDVHGVYAHQRKRSKMSAEIIHRYNEQALLQTEAEQIDSPYPDGMELKCHPSVMGQAALVTEGDDEVLWRQLPTTSPLLECSVLERQTITVSDGTTRTAYAMRVFYEGTWRGRGGIPRRYMRWFASTTHSKVFRFPMQLPDNMVPDAWKDL